MSKAIKCKAFRRPDSHVAEIQTQALGLTYYKQGYYEIIAM
jgi:hypothetical protein